MNFISVILLIMKLLLHCCCGPCSTSSIERLLSEGWEPVLFYDNANIYPEEEREKRLGELKKVAEHYKLPLLTPQHLPHEAWLEHIKGFEKEPEHGRRCEACFRFNLKEAAEAAASMGIEHFATTLTVSRFKNSAQIFAQGEDLAGFEKIDFKKKDGFNRSIVLSKELGLYRQQYCGCEFSRNS